MKDFALNEVEIKDSYLKKAFCQEQEYLLSLEADCFLAGFYEVAGKTPEHKRDSDSCEGQEFSGHRMGHYLTALAQAYVGSGDKRFFERLNYLIDSLMECQAETGYLSDFSEQQFDNLEQNLQTGMPWDTMHKVLAGLIRVYQMASVPNALTLAIRLGTWISNRVKRWDDNTKTLVLTTEYGGMNDCLYELYKESGKIEFMMAAEKFDELSLFQNIGNGTTGLDETQVNARVPKFLGALNRYLTVGEDQKFYLDAAKRFFEFAANRHRYVTLTTCNCEICNNDAMLKLARGLFQITGEKKYLDYYEDVFWNVTVADNSPETGMESFTRLNDSIYFKKDDTVYIGMYISSELKDVNMGIRVQMTAALPANPVVKVVVEKEYDGETRLAFRRPEWNKNNFGVSLKGKSVTADEEDGFAYISLEKGTTELEVVFMPEVAIHSLSGVPEMVVFKYGPLVLSAEAGAGNALRISNESVEEWKQNPDRILVRQGNSLNFRLTDNDGNRNLMFSPHYTRHDERYGIYWKLVREREKETDMPEKKEKNKTKRPLMIALLVVVLVLLLITAVLGGLALSEAGKMKQTGSKGVISEMPAPTLQGGKQDIADIGQKMGETEEITPTVTPTAVPKLMYLENPEYEAATANAGDLRGFTAFVELIGGKQYISFSDGRYKVSYKNEPEQADSSSASRCEVIISNGEKTETFYWNYYVESGSAAKLCPYLGDFCKNGREQLAFSFLADGNDSADTLHVVAGTNLLEYYVINPKNALRNLITVNGYLDAGNNMLADISSDNRNYYVSMPKCETELAKERYAPKTDTMLTYEITEDSIVLQSFVELGEGQYIGRIRGDIAYSSRDVFCLTSPKFHLFADDDFCDLDSMGIVGPVTEEELYLTRIPVMGDNGERLLVLAQEEIPKLGLNIENFKEDEHGFLAYYDNNVKISLTGVDVSKWQYDINWKKVAAAGVDYAIIRLGYRGSATEGNCAMDPYFKQNIKGALDAGLQVGVYYFTQAITVEEAIEEANIVIDALKGYNVTFPVVYDTEYLEGARANDISNEERTACVKAFCDTILAAGYTPAVYSSTNWAVLDLNLEGVSGYDFWYAYYGEPESLYLPYGFTMWQYTDSGKVDGISGGVDLNISFVDYSTR